MRPNWNKYIDQQRAQPRTKRSPAFVPDTPPSPSPPLFTLPPAKTINPTMATIAPAQTDGLTVWPPSRTDITGVITTLDCARNDARTDEEVIVRPTVSKP